MSSMMRITASTLRPPRIAEITRATAAPADRIMRAQSRLSAIVWDDWSGFILKVYRGATRVSRFPQTASDPRGAER